MSPFFKAVGGKRALVPTILPLLGLAHAERYVEPFLGGGAVFLAVRDAGFAKECVLNDMNAALADTWRAVASDPEDVITAFEHYQQRNSREFYYEVRQHPPTDLIERAGWFLYLNKHCWNGLFRVNSKGLFNVPYGDGKKKSLDADAMIAASVALLGATVTSVDFGAVEIGAGCSVYADPPYLPISKTASFTGYTPGGFSASDQLRLARWCREGADRGARVVLSNAGGLDSQAAFAEVADRVIEVTERRAVNSVGSKRGPVATRIYLFGGVP